MATAKIFVFSFRFALPAGLLFTKRNENWAWSLVNYEWMHKCIPKIQVYIMVIGLSEVQFGL